MGGKGRGCAVPVRMESLNEARARWLEVQPDAEMVEPDKTPNEPLTDEQYVETGGNQCPFCRSSSLNVGSWNPEVTAQDISCGDCVRIPAKAASRTEVMAAIVPL